MATATQKRLEDLPAFDYLEHWGCTGEIEDDVPLEGLDDFEGEGLAHVFVASCFWQTRHFEQAGKHFLRAAQDPESVSSTEVRVADRYCREHLGKALTDLGPAEIGEALRRQEQEVVNMRAAKGAAAAKRPRIPQKKEPSISPQLRTATLFFSRIGGEQSLTRTVDTVQALLFYADAVSLFARSHPLFPEEPISGKDGPVYKASRDFLQSADYDPQQPPPSLDGVFTSEESELLHKVLTVLGDVDEKKLEELVKAKPWIFAIPGELISHALMQAWFQCKHGRKVVEAVMEGGTV